MLKLMKYEWLRRRKLLSIILICFAFLEGVSIYGMYRGEGWLVLTFFIMFALFFVAMLLPLIDAIANYYSDFKNTHGYMLFLTPNNGFSLVGSKALFALIELLLSLGIVGGILVANYHIAGAFGHEGIVRQIDSIWSNIVQITGSTTMATKSIIYFISYSFVQYFNTIMLALTALTIGKTLLSGKSYNWLAALAMYIALVIGVQVLQFLILTAFGFVGDLLTVIDTPTDQLPAQMLKYLFIEFGLQIIWITGGYVTSSLLLNKRIDL